MAAESVRSVSVTSMPNEFEVGTRRQGGLIDFDPNTPHVSVVLARSSDEITVGVPWTDYSSPYSGWFVDRELTRADEDPDLPVPKRLCFQDTDGAILLIGCYRGGFKTTWHGPGSGFVNARLAVIGVRDDLDYSHLNGLRSTVSGLRSWVGTRTVSEFDDFDGERRTLTFSVRSTEPIEIPGVGGLRLMPSWAVDRDEDSYTLRDVLLVDSRFAEAVPWYEAQDHARGIRDLLVLSQWRPESQRLYMVSRDDDRIVTRDGRDHGVYWREAIAARSEKEPEPTRRRNHLIEYGEIGPEGLARWMELRDTFRRVIDPVVSSRFIGEVTGTTMLAQVGPGIEALGYLLLRRDGQRASAAKDVPLADRLRRVLRDVADVIPFDGEAWVTSTTSAYNGLKHANRKAPDELRTINAWRESVLAVRSWVASELGVDRTVLADRLQNDGQAYPYVSIQ